MPATFVGPLTDTMKPGTPVRPSPLRWRTSVSHTPQEPAPAKFTGASARDTASGFVNGGSAHYAMWGRQLGQNVRTVTSVMNDLKSKNQLPDTLLVEFGFNDIGWPFVGVELVDTMEDFIANARAANPNVRIVLANVPHRTTDYNAALAQAIPEWDTDASPVALADVTAPTAATRTRPRTTGGTPTRWASTASPEPWAPHCTTSSGSGPRRPRCRTPCPPGRSPPPPRSSSTGPSRA
ncbi:hypothetical protein OG800_47625 [Streptomyces sp. NBC_00445]|uniref:hypothetical protein n=1 Tax=Streptomyces sp. NBC_00445 TaxID=2975745 RepID=UPI002E1C6542